MSVLTARGRAILLLGVALLAAGLAAHYPVVAGLGAVLAALVVAEAVAVLTAAGVTATREVSPTVVVRHDPCVGTVVVHGRLRSGLVRTEAADRIGATLVPIDLPGQGGGPSVTASYPIPSTRRGVHTVGPLLLRRRSLAGMASRTSETDDADELRVLPRRVALRALMPGHRRAVSGGDDALELGGTDLVGLHEYTMGDDLRRLHWATSARTGTLMVRDDAEPSEPHVCVLLDDLASSYSDLDDGGSDQFEESVELAAALCRAAAEAGSPLRLRFTSSQDEVVVPGSPGRLARPETQQIEWLLAEIGLAHDTATAAFTTRELDVVVAVTGPGRDLAALVHDVGTAPTRVVAVVDPAPGVASTQLAGALVLRGPGSTSLARLWEHAAAGP
jgi:uncharacterized protein (DUF58 family)